MFCVTCVKKQSGVGGGGGEGGGGVLVVWIGRGKGGRAEGKEAGVS